MRVLHVTDRNSTASAPAAEVVEALGSRYGIELVDCRRSAFSFVTAMRIAKAVRQGEIRTVLTHNAGDAMAAISARRVSGAGFAVVCASPLPHLRHLTDEIAAEVDAWAFGQTPQADKNLGNVHIIQPYWAMAQNAPKHSGQHSPTCVSWIGDIDEPQLLEDAIRGLAAIGTGVQMRVYGTGKARLVMPCVQLSRTLKGLDIKWFGNDYKLADAITATDVAIRTSPALTEAQAWCMGAGIPVVEPSQLATAIESPSKFLTADNGVLDLSFHVEQWRDFLTTAHR